MRMKLILTISIYLLCIAILMCSCNVDDGSKNQENHNTTIYENTEITTNINDTTENPVTEGDTKNSQIEVETEQPIVNVEYSSLRFDSKKEYDDFMDKNTISENFVSYNMLKILGEFDSMVFLTNTNIGDYAQYLYSFIDDSGYELSLYVESRISKHDFHTYKDKYTCIDEINSTDMRYIDITDKTCVYHNENLLYTYIDGKLNSIIWIYEDIEYRLCGTPAGLFNYPNIETTFAGQLIYGDQANESLNKFLNSMNE